MSNLTRYTTAQSIAKLDSHDLCKIIFKFNFLLAYPLSDLQIEDWSREIARLSPKTSVADLLEILDKFMLSEYSWDVKLGIQNIFSAIKELDNERFIQEKSLRNKWNFEGKELGISFEDFYKLKTGRTLY